MNNQYLSCMMSLAEEAGKIALKYIHESESAFKSDASIITKADLEISDLAHTMLKPFLDEGHILIDEEDPQRGGYLQDEVLDAAPLVWSIDPIDGTRAYANAMPQYGISIGIIKNKRPWMGVVYFPSLRELFYCDEVDAYFVESPFTSQEKKTRIVPIDEQITSRSVFIATDQVLTNFVWKQEACHMMIFATAICEFCWPAIGRGCGSLSSVHLWDFAGSWPIVKKAGLDFRSFETGKVMDYLQVDMFHKDDQPWRLKEFFILSSERNYLILKDLISWK